MPPPRPIIPQAVYTALQVTRWAWENNLVDLHWRADRLPAYLNVFRGKHDKESVGRFLENDHNVLRGLNPKVNSEELAAVVLEQLHDRLVATKEYYP